MTTEPQTATERGADDCDTERADLLRQYDEAFAWRDWDTCELITEELLRLEELSRA